MKCPNCGIRMIAKDGWLRCYRCIFRTRILNEKTTDNKEISMNKMYIIMGTVMIVGVVLFLVSVQGVFK